MLTIFVAEIVPSLNKGEAALMHGIMKSIQAQTTEPVKFYLCSEDQEIDAAEYGNTVHVLDHPGLIPVSLDSFFKLRYFSVHFFMHILFLIAYRLFGKLSLKIFRNKLWEAYALSDVIIVGHDNAFSKFHLPLILYSKWLGKKSVVYGATIMPKVLNSKFIRKLGTYAINRADLVTTRESITFEHLQSININQAPLYCTADKAFILDPISKDKANELTENLGIDKLPKPVIGVMIVKGSTVFKGAFKDQVLTPKEKYQKHINEISQALDKVINSINCTFVFIPHCIGPGDDLDDRVCARDVQNTMTNKGSTLLIENEMRVPELKGLLGNLDMVISERTHGGINAATMFTPTLWITHTQDFRTHGIIENTLKLPECLYNIEYLENETLANKIVETYNNREKIVNTLHTNIPKAQEQTMTNGTMFKKHVMDKL